MPALRSEIRQGAYYDSVVLMQLQRGLLTLPGVLDAGAVMATPVNLELLEASGLRPSKAPSSDDLLIVVRAETDDAAGEALAQVDALLARRRASTDAEFRPKSLAAATQQLPEAAWVLVSVPGRFAAGVAGDAVRLGKNVFLYSDNVPVEDEVELKHQAAARGLLVMGPDCGTAIIGGVGFGFANRVRRGSIGLVAASGTGLQAVTSAIHALGGGVSQAIGTGGRDLHAEVGGLAALQALDVLRRDPSTKVIVVISKPPAPEVAGRLVGAARQTGKPVVLDLIGEPSFGGRLGNLHFAAGLEDAAEIAVGLSASISSSPSPSAPSAGHARYFRALFSGGTLAYESVLALQYALAPLATNVPLRPDQRLDDPLQSRGHTILDLGADDFTVGRLHPMIDNDLRLRRLRQEAADPETAVILLDVVLGEGAHTDPASEIAPAIAEALGRPGLTVVVVLVGTEEDPQGLDSQRERLLASGALVFSGLRQALAAVVERLPAGETVWPSPVPLESFASPAAINVGLETFFDSLVAQGAAALHVDWRPPAGGDERLMGILAKMKGTGRAKQAP
ncbi:MAG: bacterial FdrA family protein [Anaerolineales bacterium]|nr:bacterial FdrA family protein [Anaerolineales bacterium]